MHTFVNGLMRLKSYAVGMGNAILRNHLKCDPGLAGAMLQIMLYGKTCLLLSLSSALQLFVLTHWSLCQP